MATDDLPARAPGKYVPYGQRSYYLPEDLPPDSSFTFGDEFEDTLQDAIYQLGRLEGIGHESNTSPLLYSTLVRREAVESVLIEGAQLTFEDVFRSYDDDDGASVTKDIQEALNYEQVIRRGSRAVAEREEISLELLKDLHEMLLQNARGEADNPGSFRVDPSHIPAAQQGIEPFIPPAPTHIESLMENLVRYVDSGGEHHDLIDLGVVHYQFETVHPFADGNGRLGRVLITLQLIKEGYLSEPFLYPSAYFNRHKVEYASRMRAVSERGEWEYWLEFFVEGIRKQAAEAVDRTELLGTLRDEYHEQFGHGKTATDRLAMRLFEQPYITADDAAELLGMSDQSARNAIEELEQIDVLEEVTGKQRYREYKAREIFDVLNEPLE
jgi:Fic family protein